MLVGYQMTKHKVSCFLLGPREALDTLRQLDQYSHNILIIQNMMSSFSYVHYTEKGSDGILSLCSTRSALRAVCIGSI